MFWCLLRLHYCVSLLKKQSDFLVCCFGKLHLNLTGWEGLILHDNSAAAGQNHDVEVLLPVVGLLVPLPHHIRVMGGNQSDLKEGEILRILSQKMYIP